MYCKYILEYLQYSSNPNTALANRDLMRKTQNMTFNSFLFTFFALTPIFNPKMRSLGLTNIVYMNTPIHTLHTFNLYIFPIHCDLA